MVNFFYVSLYLYKDLLSVKPVYNFKKWTAVYHTANLDVVVAQVHSTSFEDVCAGCCFE